MKGILVHIYSDESRAQRPGLGLRQMSLAGLGQVGRGTPCVPGRRGLGRTCNASRGVIRSRMAHSGNGAPEPKRRAGCGRVMISGLKVLMAGLALAGSCNCGNAAATLTLYDGVNPLITVVDNGPTDLIGDTGLLVVRTNVGVWNVAIGTALTKPLLGSATSPVMALNIQATSTSSGSLRLVFSDNGFGPAIGMLAAIATGHVAAGAQATFAYDVYGDPFNILGAQTVYIAATGTTSLPPKQAIVATGSGRMALDSPFSLT